MLANSIKFCMLNLQPDRDETPIKFIARVLETKFIAPKVAENVANGISYHRTGNWETGDSGAGP